MIEDKEKSILSLDNGFPERVFRMSFFLSLLAVVCSLSSASFMCTVSIAIGCFISIMVYKILWWTIQQAVLQKSEDKKWKIKKLFLKVSLLKYFAVGAILLSACLLLDINVIAMALGLSVVLAVIILKIASKLLVNYLNRSVKVPFRDIH